MTDFLVVEGVPPWDGRYEFDLDTFTVRHWGWLRRYANYMPLTIEQGLRGGDPELFAAFAVVVLHQAGRIEPDDASDIYDRFLDVPAGGTVRYETDRTEADADPPPSDASDGEKTSSPGDGTSPSSGMWAPPGGTPASATSESPPLGLAS